MNKIFRVLSIDAWADHQACPECGSEKFTDTTKSNKLKCSACLHEFGDNEGISWTWNNWFIAGTYDENNEGPLTDENAMKYFNKEFIISGHENKYEIDDDQYNLILVNKENNRPMIAIEYGATL